MNQKVEIALDQLKSAREYLFSMLEGLSEEEWFFFPKDVAEGLEFKTNVAWQVGHLAMAEYGLLLFRQRGRAEVDLGLMPGKFRKAFGKGSTPVADPEKSPGKDAILQRLEKIHCQVLEEAPTYTEESLAEPVGMPYFGYANKFGAMLMASHHEMLHCGQIGILRRLMGKDPVR